MKQLRHFLPPQPMPPGPNAFAASGAMSAGIRRTGPLDPVWHRVMSVPLVREWRVISDSIFVLTSFVFGLFWVITFAVAGAVGTGLLVIGVGIPILAALFALAIFGAQQERSRLRIFLGEDIPSPYRYLPTEGPIWRRAWGMVRNPQLWRDIAYLLLLFPMGVLGLTAVSVPFNFLIALPIAMVGGNTSVYWWQVNHFMEAVVAFAFGLVLVVPFSALVNITALLHVRAGRRLLAPSNEEMLIERVEELTESRSAVMRAMHLERRRIERDLHDGAQQRLVSLAMELGLAREKMHEDPEGARKLLEASHEDAKLVLAELRDLVRGIHPAVLTDRGLDAAISAIAGRSPIPVEVDVDLDRRQPDEVEGSAYFVVVEALTNIAKHSEATKARVHITRDRGWLKLVVSDNGKGGARLEAGSGLRGLRDRVTALDGRFSLDSPVGAGTTIRAEIPCL